MVLLARVGVALLVLALRLAMLPGPGLRGIENGQQHPEYRHGAEELQDAAPGAGGSQGARDRIELSAVHLVPSHASRR
jgi:hypothetical protein